MMTLEEQLVAEEQRLKVVAKFKPTPTELFLIRWFNEHAAVATRMELGYSDTTVMMAAFDMRALARAIDEHLS